ncbi:MAG: hypothetical protein U0939_04470 [Pirellulales bacterium]
MTANASACTTVAKGAVGESGASTLLVHRVASRTPKLAVLRVTESNLCPNTGVIGVLAVNGVPIAHDSLSKAKPTLQVEASDGDYVSACIYTVPLFNGVLCTRLGDLHFSLDECDLVGVADDKQRVGGRSTGCPLAHCGWYAWNDRQPPAPASFHLYGEVQVANPGIEPQLVYRNPQGFNSHIVLLDLLLIQKPGIWIQIPTWRQVSYSRLGSTYQSAEIFCNDKPFAAVAATEVS